MASKKDITKTGPIGLKGIRGTDLYNLLNTLALSGNEDAINVLLGLSAPTPRPHHTIGASPESYIEPYELPTNSGFEELGLSVYDLPYLFNTIDPSTINENRAESLSSLTKLFNGTAKMLTTGVTTFLDSTVGALWGIGLGAVNAFDDDPTTNFILGLWDNDFNKAMTNIQDSMEKIAPNYYTALEQENAWYQNILSANFWGDKVLKNAGFTIGALAAAVLTDGVGAAFGKTALTIGKGATWLAKMGGMGLSGVAKGNKLSREVGLVVNFAVNSAIAANGEAAIEAINATKEELKLLDKNLSTRRLELLSLLNPFDPNYQYLIALIDKAIADYRTKASAELRDAGNSVYGLNMAILGLSNAVEFGHILKGGFNQSARLTDYALKAEGKQVDASKFMNALINGKNAEVTNEVSKSFKKVALNTLKNAASEGWEEGALNIASNSKLMQTSAKMNEYAEDSLLGSKINPEVTNDLVSYSKAFIKTLSDLFGGFEKPGWEEVFLGALTGGMGFMSLLVHPRDLYGEYIRDTSGRKITKIRPIWEGGFMEAYRSTNYEYNQNQKLIDLINTRLKDPAFIERTKHAVSSLGFLQQMDNALRENDMVKFKNSEAGKLAEDVLFFKNVGMLDDYKQIFKDLLHIDDKTLQQLYAATSNSLGQTGNDLLTPELVRKEYLDKATSTLEKIELLENLYDYVDNQYREASDVFKEEMTYENFRLWDTERRIKELLRTAKKDINNLKKLGLGVTDNLKKAINILATMGDSSLIEGAFTVFLNTELLLLYLDEALGLTENLLNDLARLLRQYKRQKERLKIFTKRPKDLMKRLNLILIRAAAKKLSLDSEKLVDSIKNAESVIDVDDIFAFADPSIREQLYKEIAEGEDENAKKKLFEWEASGIAIRLSLDSASKIYGKNTEVLDKIKGFITNFYKLNKFDEKVSLDAINKILESLSRGDISEIEKYFDSKEDADYVLYIDGLLDNEAIDLLSNFIEGMKDDISYKSKLLDLRMTLSKAASKRKKAKQNNSNTSNSSNSSNEEENELQSGKQKSKQGKLTLRSIPTPILDRFPKPKDLSWEEVNDIIEAAFDSLGMNAKPLSDEGFLLYSFISLFYDKSDKELLDLTRNSEPKKAAVALNILDFKEAKQSSQEEEQSQNELEQLQDDLNNSGKGTVNRIHHRESSVDKAFSEVLKQLGLDLENPTMSEQEQNNILNILKTTIDKISKGQLLSALESPYEDIASKYATPYKQIDELIVKEDNTKPFLEANLLNGSLVSPFIIKKVKDNILLYKDDDWLKEHFGISLDLIIKILNVVDYILNYLKNEDIRIITSTDDSLKNCILTGIKVSKKITNLVTSDLGWFIDTLDGTYLVTGVLGYDSKSPNTKTRWLDIIDTVNADVKVSPITQKWYVSPKLEHVFSIDHIGDGRLVDTNLNQSNSTTNILELIDLENRVIKGYHLALRDLKWGVVYLDGVHLVNFGGKEIIHNRPEYVLKETDLGKVYVYIPMPSGVYYKHEIAPLYYTELNNSKIKDSISSLIETTIKDLDTQSIISLKNRLVLDDLLYIKFEDNGTITVRYQPREGKEKTKSLIGNEDLLIKLLEEVIAEINPRVNVTISDLSSEVRIKQLIEAGALNTRSAVSLHGHGANFTIVSKKEKGNSNQNYRTGSSPEGLINITVASKLYLYDTSTNKWKEEGKTEITKLKIIDFLNIILDIENGKYGEGEILTYKKGKIEKTKPGKYFFIDNIKGKRVFHKDDHGNYRELSGLGLREALNLAKKLDTFIKVVKGKEPNSPEELIKLLRKIGRDAEADKLLLELDALKLEEELRKQRDIAKLLILLKITLDGADALALLESSAKEDDISRMIDLLLSDIDELKKYDAINSVIPATLTTITSLKEKLSVNANNNNKNVNNGKRAVNLFAGSKKYRTFAEYLSDSEFNREDRILDLLESKGVSLDNIKELKEWMDSHEVGYESVTTDEQFETLLDEIIKVCK